MDPFQYTPKRPFCRVGSRLLITAKRLPCPKTSKMCYTTEWCPMHPILHIHISNISEDVWPFIATFPARERRQEIIENADLAERDLVANLDRAPLLFLSPIPIAPDYQAYLHHTIPTSQFSVLTIPHHRGRVCRELKDHLPTFSKLKASIASARRVIFTTQVVSPDAVRLAQLLKKQFPHIEFPEFPLARALDAADRYGSKSGTRALINDSCRGRSRIPMPKGVICSSRSEAITAALAMTRGRRGVVIKTAKGHSGAGVLLFPSGTLPWPSAEREKIFFAALKKESYWKQFPIVVEEYIVVNPNIGGGFPNIECKIQPNGEITPLYTCGMLMGQGGVFQGVVMGPTLFSPTIQRTLSRMGKNFGSLLVRRGYRGYFDVDCVATKNGSLRMTESNLRRTGGTHAYHLVRLLLGNDMRRVWVITENLRSLLRNTPYRSFNTFFTRIKTLVYSPARKEGIVFTSARLLRKNQCGYVVIARSQSRARELQTALFRLLGITG